MDVEGYERTVGALIWTVTFTLCAAWIFVWARYPPTPLGLMDSIAAIAAIAAAGGAVMAAVLIGVVRRAGR